MNYHPYIAALSLPGVVMWAGSCTERQNEAELKLAEINHLSRSIYALMLPLLGIAGLWSLFHTAALRSKLKKLPLVINEE